MYFSNYAYGTIYCSSGTEKSFRVWILWGFFFLQLQWRAHCCLQCLDEDETRQTGLRGTDRKVAGDGRSATFRCHRPARKTHGHVTLHQPPALLVHRKLLTGNIWGLALSPCQFCGCECFSRCVSECGPATRCERPDSRKRKVISLSANNEWQQVPVVLVSLSAFLHSCLVDLHGLKQSKLT